MEDQPSFEERFKYATEQTKIHRERKSNLFTFGATILPYIFIAKSSINQGDTLLRKGQIKTEKPTILLGDDLPHFSGFEDYDNEERKMSLLFGRGFQFPNLNYQNSGGQLEIISKEEQALIDETLEQLDAEHDSRTAVISGPEESWALSLLIYAGEMTKRSAPGNVKDMFERGQFNSDGFSELGL